MLNIKWEQPSTKRGAIKVLVSIAMCWAWFNGDNEQAMGAITIGTALTGFLGFADDNKADVKK